VIDTTAKSAPVIVGTYDTPGFANGLWMSAGKAYVADGENGVLILDVSTPSAITQVGSYNTAGNARGLTRIMVDDPELGSQLYVYVADGNNGLVSLKLDAVTNTLTPFEQIPIAGFVEDVFKSVKIDNFLFLASGTAGLRVVKIQDPENLVSGGYCDTPGYASNVMYYGGYVYVADGESGVQVVNWDANAVPPSPIAGSYNTTGLASRMAWAEGFVMLADYSALRVINALTPSAPVEVTSAAFESPTVTEKAAAVDSTVYLVDPYQGLRIFDVSNLAIPALLGVYDTPGTAYDVAVSGDLAYIADGTQGLRLLDISNPNVPIEINSFRQESYSDYRAVALDGETAFVANGEFGLVAIIFAEDPAQNQQHILDASLDAMDVALADGYAYVADEENGLVIIDRDPLGEAYQTGSIITSGQPHAVAVRGNYAYLADGAAGLRIFDVSDPANPTEVGFFDTQGTAVDITLVGSLAYVADSLSGLSVVNIANPSAPVSVAVFKTLGSARGVAWSQGGFFVADADGGMITFTTPPGVYSISLPLTLR
jgi:hypothetical protein